LNILKKFKVLSRFIQKPLILLLLQQAGCMGTNCKIFDCLELFNSFQKFKIKIKNKKAMAVDILSEAYPMIPLSCRSNLAGRYL
jgi:hypothetical protein